MRALKIYHIGLCATPGTNNGLQRAFKKVSEYKEIYTGHHDLNNQIIKDCEAFEPDIVFIQIQTPGILSISTIKRIRHVCKSIVNFTGDVRSPLPEWYIELGKEIDLTLFVSMDDVHTARENGIKSNWLQLGFDDQIYNCEVTPKSSADIIFTANNYDHFLLSKNRIEVAYALREEFKERFQLYGSGWKIPSINSNNSMEQQAAIYRGCKIAINYSNFNQAMYTSDRMLRIMGSGAFCLSHEFKDFDKVYTDKENIAVFNSITDMIEKCYYYLGNESERNRIAKNGYDLTHKLYTWDSMINNLIKLCE